MDILEIDDHYFDYLLKSTKHHIFTCDNKIIEIKIPRILYGIVSVKPFGIELSDLYQSKIQILIQMKNFS